MDKLILGLLMMRRLTVYEIRSIIRQYFQSMCSDSLGSIRAAVNKLMKLEMITCSEYVERSINKKQYSITDKGRRCFSDWTHTPADIALPKNMELGKFLFMGFVPENKRLQLFDEIIAGLKNTKSDFKKMFSSINIIEGTAQGASYLESDTEYRNGVVAAVQCADIHQITKDIGEYQMLCMQYEIDTLSFQIEWFGKLKTKMEESQT
ncbi:MAG: helix-turn-helix transcriptional regulator [Oscillospiraceae bacterium]|jgi:DNA-binding PadR family transcriptional regulator|nr:helix-turn-helix transcriptional regulator [Oscillospiraceae bacterium]